MKPIVQMKARQVALNKALELHKQTGMPVGVGCIAALEQMFYHGREYANTEEKTKIVRFKKPSAKNRAIIQRKLDKINRSLDELVRLLDKYPFMIMRDDQPMPGAAPIYTRKFTVRGGV